MAMSTGKVVALIQAMGGSADPAVIEAAVQDWLDNHPEATTTVQDGSITEAKLATTVAQKLGLISSLSDEIEAIQTATTTDIGKALSPKTVTNGKVTEWQYKAVGGGSDGAVDDVQLDGQSIVQNGIANIPIANSSTIGVMLVDDVTGFQMINKKLYLRASGSDDIKAGNAERKAVTPLRQHMAAFYGLAKAAGDSTQSASSNAVGTYTDEAKVAIKAMLGIKEWKHTELTVNDYDSTLGMFVFDAGEGNEIEEVRVAGQWIYSDNVTGRVIGAGFGNTEGRTTYNEFVYVTTTSPGYRCAIQVNGYNMIFNDNYRCQLGNGCYAVNLITTEAVNADIVCNLPMSSRGTNMYHNFNNPRYFHVSAPTGATWARIFIDYKLR